jgi:hypothetical protein
MTQRHGRLGQIPQVGVFLGRFNRDDARSGR